MKKRLLNIEEASQYLGISKGSLYKLNWQRRIPVVKIGKSLRFDIQDLETWIQESKVGINSFNSK